MIFTLLIFAILRFFVIINFFICLFIDDKIAVICDDFNRLYLHSLVYLVALDVFQFNKQWLVLGVYFPIYAFERMGLISRLDILR